MAPLPSVGGHIPALDGLRGIAVLMVLVFHYLLLGGAEPVHVLDRIVYGVAMAGWSGVDLFFVLSGFLITGILYDSRRQATYFRTFYARRALRIFPLYYGFLFACFFLLPLLPHYREILEVDPATRTSLWAYFLNIRVALTDWNVVPLHVAPFWSLAIEEQFYLAWPLVVFFLSRRALLRVCAAMVVFGLLLRSWLHLQGMAVAAEALTLARMDGLVVGAALALAVRDPRDFRTVLRWCRPLLLVVVPALAAMRVWRGGFTSADPVIGTLGLPLIALAFGATLVLAVTAPSTTLLGRTFGSRHLRFFGKYSYAIYVFHQAVALPLPALGITAVTLSPFPGFMLPGQLAFFALGTGLSVLAAVASWHLYEKHFLRLKERFAYGTAEARPEPAVALAPGAGAM